MSNTPAPVDFPIARFILKMAVSHEHPFDSAVMLAGLPTDDEAVAWGREVLGVELSELRAAALRLINRKRGGGRCWASCVLQDLMTPLKSLS